MKLLEREMNQPQTVKREKSIISEGNRRFFRQCHESWMRELQGLITNEDLTFESIWVLENAENHFRMLEELERIANGFKAPNGYQWIFRWFHIFMKNRSFYFKTKKEKALGLCERLRTLYLEFIEDEGR